MATTTRTTSPIVILLLLAALIASTHGFNPVSRSVHRNRYVPSIRSSPLHTAPTTTPCCWLLKASPDNNNSNERDQVDPNRRKMWTRLAVRIAQASIALPLAVVLTRPAWAVKQSRNDGYAVQKTESEWKKQLSPVQYSILREGGTERPYFSILENEERPGTYECVACGTPLFESSKKFHSGTGWPSFADVLKGVEVEKVDPITANIAGAESRCATCGGHLGDVFRDGFLYQGTPAAETGKRYCIDGAALLFRPASGGDAVPGDRPAKSKA
jgi:peptide-methionine (R)-S-oxide reductase